MKVYISSDIEGTCGIVNWEETNLDYPLGEYHKIQMTKEVKSACDGANKYNCDLILVKDAHGSARSINPALLPQNVNLIRGWTNNPLIMMSGIDNSFDATIFIGYHSGASEDGNPLSHTMNSSKYDYVKINGEIATEFMINAYTSAYYNVPVAFLSGDELLCKNAKKLNPNIITVSVSKGIGNASLSIHPEVALKNIQDGVEKALSGDLSRHIIKLPKLFFIEIKFKNHYDAYKASFYPGCKLLNTQTISFETNDYYEFLRMFLFI
ncbi:M55 family metallopeptidase [Paraclostridium ghonii]|uniref:M55 family metallopeptidase n=1 Tax=Paraclostridium ghonii TaxID=29358 RepID=UPI00202CFDDB|nr:M55 family metallopeptidase [Paeniclostridium ghonii]MCM0167375.1 M55 family metallopeptidase [Paeniclostridium ghonii]